MSRLTARIMAIMLFPLAIFLVGLLSLDQYRTTLIQSEFVALERQGFTLARSLALAEAERDRRVARRQLSPETMTHLIPLVGLGSSLRARVFQPNGSLLADTARRSGFQPNVDIRRHRDKSWRRKIRNNLNDMVAAASAGSAPLTNCQHMSNAAASAPANMPKSLPPCRANHGVPCGLIVMVI